MTTEQVLAVEADGYRADPRWQEAHERYLRPRQTNESVDVASLRRTRAVNDMWLIELAAEAEAAQDKGGAA